MVEILTLTVSLYFDGVAFGLPDRDTEPPVEAENHVGDH